MPLKNIFLAMLLFACIRQAHGQTMVQDTIPAAVADTSDSDLDDLLLDDAILSDFASFLDSLLAPRSFFSLNLSASRGYFNYKTDRILRVNTVEKMMYSPALGYFHKSGPGISATAFMLGEEQGLNVYQMAVSPSFDYLKNMDFATGISYTHFFTRDSLRFYVSPLRQELNAYFTWRKWWLQPSVSFTYGWGSSEEAEERINLIESLRLRRRLLDYFNRNIPSTIYDFSVTSSLQHHFYKMDIFSDKDYIRFTPQLIFNAGTQQFGFNQQNSNLFTRYSKTTRTNLLSTARSLSLAGDSEFRPLSLGLNAALEYNISKIFVRPALLLDYYFPAREDNFTTVFSIQAGLLF